MAAASDPSPRSSERCLCPVPSRPSLRRTISSELRRRSPPRPQAVPGTPPRIFLCVCLEPRCSLSSMCLASARAHRLPPPGRSSPQAAPPPSSPATSHQGRATALCDLELTRAPLRTGPRAPAELRRPPPSRGPDGSPRSRPGRLLPLRLLTGMCAAACMSPASSTRRRRREAATITEGHLGCFAASKSWHPQRLCPSHQVHHRPMKPELQDLRRLRRPM